MGGALRVLVLAGTTEARALCAELAALPGLDVRAALAGATRDPAPYTVPVRRGGFGGAAGLARHLAAGGIGALVDATHPFAATISRHAVAAASTAGVPLLRLVRPEWQPGPGEAWTMAADLAAAAALLPAGARVYLATGRGSEVAFRTRGDLHLHLRVIDPPAAPLPANWTLTVARPPFTVEAEIAAFTEFGVTHLVCKNAGGASGRTKLDAAARLSLPVMMVERPALPATEEAASVAEALAWVRARA
jgi:precorrin-6A/cobalt-precorrin-6A reductase